MSGPTMVEVVERVVMALAEVGFAPVRTARGGVACGTFSGPAGWFWRACYLADASQVTVCCDCAITAAERGESRSLDKNPCGHPIVWEPRSKYPDHFPNSPSSQAVPPRSVEPASDPAPRPEEGDSATDKRAVGAGSSNATNPTTEVER